MLSSLRSLVPKEWDSEHEVAWNWLWENLASTYSCESFWSHHVQGHAQIPLKQLKPPRAARNVERMIKSHMGKPHSQEKALERFISGLSPDDVTQLRRHIYQKLGTQLVKPSNRVRPCNAHFVWRSGFFRSRQQGKTTSNSPPPDCTSSQTRSLR